MSAHFSPPARVSRPRGPLRIFKDILSIGAAASIALVARTSLADHYVVPSGSMEPTIEVGDRILVDKLAFGVRLPIADRYLVPLAEPRPGDVVVLGSPENGITLLKRVVAGPGDMVTVRGGHVDLNGTSVRVTSAGSGELEHLGATPHSLRIIDGGGPDFGPVRVPPDHYLVMGDNRGNSHDGRSFGFVTRDSIRGRAVRVFLRNGAPTWRPL
jgi:signal peptidase I